MPDNARHAPRHHRRHLRQRDTQRTWMSPLTQRCCVPVSSATHLDLQESRNTRKKAKRNNKETAASQHSRRVLRCSRQNKKRKCAESYRHNKHPPQALRIGAAHVDARETTPKSRRSRDSPPVHRRRRERRMRGGPAAAPPPPGGPPPSSARSPRRAGQRPRACDARGGCRPCP